MARFLFVVPPLTGHVNPTVSVAAQLVQRGHEVAWVGHPGKVRPLLPDGATLFELDDRVPAALVEEMTTKAHSVRGLSGLKFLWEDFLLPLARAMVPGVEAAVEALQPDVLIVDQQALAGGIVARRRDLPWATSTTTSAGVTDPLKGLPKVHAWLLENQAALQREFGLEPVAQPDCSPECVVVFSTSALIGDIDFPAHYHLVGPSVRARGDRDGFEWDKLDAAVPKVLVSLGTVNADRGARFYRAVVEAFTGAELQIILAAPPELVGEVPDNILVQGWVPQVALLPEVDAVVSHAGHNTVCEALLHGVPLVVAPIKDDQPVVAQQVADAGAGVRIRFGRVTAKGLRAAVREVLEDGRYRAAAEEIGRSFAEAGGAAAAAVVLEELLL